MLVVGMIATMAATLFVSPARAATSDFTVPAGVTMTDGGENCNGVVPTPGSANTNKVLDPRATQDLNPGGSVSYLITFPSNPNNIGTFEIVDCVLLVGPGGAPRDFKEVLGEVTFSKVNNSADFELAFKFAIPADAAIGDQICNVAKTTESPSKSPGSNRKAGPACFVIGGSGRVEKLDKATGLKLDGATFDIHDCKLGAGADPALQPIIVSLQNAAGATIGGAPVADPKTGLVSGDVTAATIAFNGPSGSSCQVTETAPPPGYELPPAGERTVTVEIGANRQTVYAFNDVAVPTQLALVKTADDDTVNAGSTIGYTIMISNAAGAATARGVTITDTLPTGDGITWSIDHAVDGCSIGDGVLTCAFGDLPGGANRSVHLSSPTTEQSCAAYQNTAQVTATNGTAPAASDATTVLCPGLNLAKTADDALVDAGSPIGFTITVTNTGDGRAAGVVMTDPLPTGPGIDWSIATPVTGCNITAGNDLVCSFPALEGGQSRSVHVTSPTTPEGCKPYTNTATVTAVNGGSAPPATAGVTVQCPAVDLVKTADDQLVDVGERIGFVITVRNAGPGTARAVVVSDTLPVAGAFNWAIASGRDGDACTLIGKELSCAFGDLPAGASRSVHVTSPTTVAVCKTIPNTASALVANGPAPAPATAKVDVRCPKLDLQKTADDPSVLAGEQIGFTITATNGADAGTATGVVLTDELMAGNGVAWAIDSDSSAAELCTLSGTTLSCALGDMVAGASRGVHLVSPTTRTGCRTYDNTARLTATNADPAIASASIAATCPTGTPTTLTSPPTPPSVTTPPVAVLPAVVQQEPTTTTTTLPTTVLGAELVRTGADLARLIRFGGLAMILGAMAVLAGSRRPRRQRIG